MSTAQSQPLRLSDWIAVARLLTLRGKGAPASFNGWFILSLSLLSLATWILVDWLQNQPDVSFYWYALPALAWYVLGVLLVAALIGRSSTPKLAFGDGLVLVLAVIPVAILVHYFASTYLSSKWLAIGMLVGYFYLIAYLARGLRAMTGALQRAALGVAVLSAIAFQWATSALYVDPSVWFAQDADESNYEVSRDQAESLLFSQPARIDAALAAIPARDGDSPQAFFVGFAGYGEQRVFAAEIGLAAQVIDERFEIGARRVLLLNDQRALEGAPLATVTALRYTLKGLATKMNLAEDTLILSLSSHGSQDASLSVSNGGLPLMDLSAQELAATLKQSGIKWRVIIISACYAGGFIDSLRDPYTIVITAAAKDRTSFGCADDRDLTYFGEAFYRDALPKAASLRDAFYEARQSIAVREKQEGVKSSNPQAYFGAEIERRLKAAGATESRTQIR